MSHCVKHTRCPKCQENGKDRSGNNLAIYDDGSSYCFSCGFSETATGIQRFTTKKVEPRRGISLPADVDEFLPEVARNFLKQYELTEHDTKVNLVLWSSTWERLCFPIFDDTGLIAWQGRYLGNDPKKAKWFSQGDLKNIIHLVGHRSSEQVVLTEDLISAIKVGKVSNLCASPIFGSHISSVPVLYINSTFFHGLSKY